MHLRLLCSSKKRFLKTCTATASHCLSCGSSGAKNDPFPGNVPCLATVMVSHHWRNLFGHLVAAVVAYASGETSYETTAQQLKEKNFEDLRR